MTDHEPTQYTATVGRGYNTLNPRKSGMRIYTVKKEWHEIGVTTAQTVMDHEVRVYSPERTICDILRPNANIELQDRQTALREYVRRKDKNIPMLMEYATLFKVDKTIKQYLEVLL